jgi:hypothetical protein
MGIPSFVFGLYHAISKLVDIPRSLHILILSFFLFQIWHSEVRQQFQFFLFGLFYCHPKTRDIFNYDTLQEILLFIVCDIVVVSIFFYYCGDYVRTGNRRY